MPGALVRMSDPTPDDGAGGHRVRPWDRPPRGPTGASDVVVVEGQSPNPETITEPAKLMRIASMVRELLERDPAGVPGRRGPCAGSVRSTTARSASSRGALARTCKRGAGVSSLLRWKGSPPSRRSVWRRPSSSDGSRVCSTASRRPCSRSRPLPARSSTRSGDAVGCPANRKSCLPGQGGPGQYL